MKTSCHLSLWYSTGESWIIQHTQLLLSFKKVIIEKLCIAFVFLLRNISQYRSVHLKSPKLSIQLLTSGLQWWMPQLLCQMETQSHGHWGLTWGFLYFHSLALSAIYTTRLLPKAIHHSVTCYSLTRCPTEPLLMDHHIRLTSFHLAWSTTLQGLSQRWYAAWRWICELSHASPQLYRLSTKMTVNIYMIWVECEWNWMKQVIFYSVMVKEMQA